MKIIVTGSDGCVGSALKNLCAADNDWIFLSRKDCDLINREQTVNFFKMVRPDYVVHLASYVPGFYNINRVDSFSNNVRINENVLEAANAVGINRGMFFLSVNMFSETLSKFPMDESMIFEGSLSGVFEGYAQSKRMLALQCNNYNIQYNRKYFGVIPCNIYGPNDNLNSGRLIPNIISKFLKASKDNSGVVVNGTGNPLRQFIYSPDLAKIIKYLILNYSDVRPVICCGDTEISVKNLTYQIAGLFNFKNSIEFDTNKQDGCFRKTVTNTYLRQVMPDVSFTSMDIGLKETISSIRVV